MPARRKKVKGNWLFSLFWNSYVTSVYFAIEYGYNSCKHYLWYLSSLIRKCFWIFPSNIAPNATTSYSEIRGWFFAQWNFQVKIHQKLPYFWRIFFFCNIVLLGIKSIHNSNFLTDLNFPPKQKSWFFKKLRVISITITSRLQVDYLFWTGTYLYAEIWSN